MIFDTQYDNRQPISKHRMTGVAANTRHIVDKIDELIAELQAHKIRLEAEIATNLGTGDDGQ